MEGNGKTSSEEFMHGLIEAVNHMRDELVKNTVELAKNNARLDQTNAKLDQTNAELKGLRGDVEELKVDVRGLRGDVGELKVDVRGLRGDVGELRVDVLAVRNATSNGFELFARTDARLGATDHELRDRVERIEQHLGLQPTP